MLLNRAASILTDIIHNEKIIQTLIMSTMYEKSNSNSPVLIEISPMAHVALLHTDMNSGVRLAPSTGINSAKKMN
jgi:hypothetical protein